MTSKNVLRCIAVLALAGAAALSGCGGGGGGGGGSGPGIAPPAVDGPAWWGFGRDAQHSGLSGTATQSLTRVVWSTPVDLAPQYTSGGALLIHYGSPVVTSRNTVIEAGPFFERSRSMSGRACCLRWIH